MYRFCFCKVCLWFSPSFLFELTLFTAKDENNQHLFGNHIDKLPNHAFSLHQNSNMKFFLLIFLSFPFKIIPILVSFSEIKHRNRIINFTHKQTSKQANKQTNKHRQTSINVQNNFLKQLIKNETQIKPPYSCPSDGGETRDRKRLLSQLFSQTISLNKEKHYILGIKLL